MFDRNEKKLRAKNTDRLQKFKDELNIPVYKYQVRDSLTGQASFVSAMDAEKVTQVLKSFIDLLLEIRKEEN